MRRSTSRRPLAPRPPCPHPLGGRLHIELLEDRIVPAIPDGTVLVCSSPSNFSSQSQASFPSGLFGVSPTTGAQFAISTGGLFKLPSYAVEAPNGLIYVADLGTYSTGAIIRVDPNTGQQSLVTTGGYLNEPPSMTYLNGYLYVANEGEGWGALQYIIRVDPNTGQQSLVSTADNGISTGGNSFYTLNDASHNDFEVPGKADPAKPWQTNQWVGWTVRIVGGTGTGQERVVASNSPTQLTLATPWSTIPDASSTYVVGFSTQFSLTAGPGNTLYLIDSPGGWPTSFGSEILSVNVTTGIPTPISRGQYLSHLQDLGMAPNGDIISDGATSQSDTVGSIIRTNPITGVQTIVSQHGNPYPLYYISALAVDSVSGMIYTGGISTGTTPGIVFAIDPSTGRDRYVTQGGSLSLIESLAVYHAVAQTQVATTTTLNSSANPAALGQPITFTATVSGGGQGSPSGVITFQDGGTALGQAALTPNGGFSTASLSSASLGQGSHTITAAYSGDGTFLPSSTSLGQTVVLISTSSTSSVTSSANPQLAGQPVSWTASVAPLTGPVNLVNFETGDFSQVAARINGAIVSSPALDGSYSLLLQRNSSVSSVEIRQSGATYYSLPTAYYSFQFEYTSNSGEGGIANFQDTASAYKAALHLSPTGKLMLYGSSAFLGTGTTTLNPNQVYTIGVKLGTGSSAPWEVRINGVVEMSGTANLGATNNGSINLGGNGAYTDTYYYDDVSINAQGYPGPVPTGTVQFLVDGSNYGAPVALVGGSATSPSTASLSPGSHTVTTTYSGDAVYAPSNATLTQSINAVSNTASITSVTSSTNPQLVGQPVSWTATVAALLGPASSTNFETGDLSQVASWNNAAVVSSPALDGNYSLLLQRNNSVANVEIRQSGSSYYSLPTAYYSFQFEYTSNSGEGGIANFQDTASAYKAALHLSPTGKLMLYGSSAFLGTGTTTLNPNQVYTIGVKLGTGSSAPWEVRINGVVEMSGTANLGATNNGSIRLGGNGAYTDTYYFDDVSIGSQGYPGPVPTGTVQFLVDGVAYGNPVPVVGGSATSPSTTSLTPGSHTVTVNYSGDATYAPSSTSLSGGQNIMAQQVSGPTNYVDFETGDLSQVAASNNAAVVSSPVLDGSYSLLLQRNSSVANVEIRQSGGSYYNLPTAYYNFLFEYTSSSGEGGIANFQDTASAYKAALHLGSSGKLSFYGSSAFLGIGSTTLNPNQMYTISVKIGTGPLAAWEVRVNGNLEMSGIGDFGANNNGSINLGGNGAYTDSYYYDDLTISSQGYPGGNGSGSARQSFTAFVPAGRFELHGTSPGFTDALAGLIDASWKESVLLPNDVLSERSPAGSAVEQLFTHPQAADLALGKLTELLPTTSESLGLRLPELTPRPR